MKAARYAGLKSRRLPGKYDGHLYVRDRGRSVRMLSPVEILEFRRHIAREMEKRG